MRVRLSVSTRNRLRRVRRLVNQLTGRDLRFCVQVRCARERLGSDYGGWVVYPRGISRDSVVYSIGTGEDISFDVAMIERFGVVVQAFDPTPKAIGWLAQHEPTTGFVFHPLGVASYDGQARFVLTQAEHVSYHLSTAEERGADTLEAPVNRLPTIMRTLGHDRVDVLKMDIEGAEYAVIDDLCESHIRVGQLLVEFHHTIGVGESLARTRRTVTRLREAGYRIFSISPNGWEYSFLGPEAVRAWRHRRANGSAE